jgi:NADH dehydrogenase
VTSEGGTDPELSRQVNVEGTERLFRAASAAGVSRWIQISSMSAHPGSTSVYGRTKLAADDYLRRAVKGPAWTILRPSLIYGPGDRGLVAKTLGLLEKLPFLPMVGSGEELLRPILVSDVARAALTCLERPDLAGRTYMIGGADEVSLNDFMKRLLAGRGMRRPLVHLPIPVCMILARLLTLAVKSPPLTVDNVLGVLQAQRVDTRFARRDWAFDPAGLERGLDLTFAPENR